MATKRIKFIKPYQMFGVGQEATLDAPIADLLIQRGRAEAVIVPISAPKPTLTSKKALRKNLRNANR